MALILLIVLCYMVQQHNKLLTCRQQGLRALTYCYIQHKFHLDLIPDSNYKHLFR